MRSLSTHRRHRLVALALCYLLLATPVARHGLEANMSAHVLIQMPLLVAIGAGAGQLLAWRWQSRLLAGAGGPVPLTTLALMVSGYWMLPRAMDAALAGPAMEIAKFVSLPLLVGLPLVLAWRPLTLIGRGFVLTNLMSMLAVLGWLYIVAPVRVCNNYLVDAQASAGWWMVRLAILSFLFWMGSWFIGPDRSTTADAACGAVPGSPTDGH